MSSDTCCAATEFCIKSLSISVFSSPVIPSPSNPILLVLVQQNISCNDSADGSATVNANGGTSPYTYAWSSGETTKNLSALDPGNYTVTITDSKNCSKDTSLTISEPTSLSVTKGNPSTIAINSTTDVASSASLGGIPFNVLTSFNTVAPLGLITGTGTTIYGYDSF